MLLEHDDYLPEALAAAKEELRKRKLSPENMAQIAAEAVQSRRLAAESAAQEQQERRRSVSLAHFCLVLAASPDISHALDGAPTWSRLGWLASPKAGCKPALQAVGISCAA